MNAKTKNAIIEAIATARNWIEVETKANDGVVTRAIVDKYASEIRPVLNSTIFCAIVGVEAIQNKDGNGGKLKVIGPMMSNAEKVDVMKALEEFQTSIEIPFTSAIINTDAIITAATPTTEPAADDAPDDEDMDIIPSKPGRLDYCTNKNLFGSNINLKDAYNLFQSDFMFENSFGPSSIEELYELGKLLRKKRFFKRFIIGGSVAVVVVGGVITYALMHNNNSSKGSAIENTDYDDDSDSDINIDIDDDTPVVETDTASSAAFSLFGYSV